MDTLDVIKKLRLTDSQHVLIINAPQEYQEIIKIVNPDLKGDKENSYDFIQIFATTQLELEALLLENAKHGKYDCLFWACYPKAGKLKSNIKRDSVWKAMELIKLRPVTQISIDDVWSALRGRPAEKVGK